MRKIQFTLAAFAVLVFCAVAATTASAEEALGWLESGATLTTSKEIDSVSTLLLEDTDTLTAILCSSEGLGDVGPGAEDEVLSITNTLCSFETAGECNSGQAVTFTLVHLPWLTLLELVENTLIDMLEANGAGSPGWDFKCTSNVGVEALDECTVALAYTLVSSLAGGVVDTEFNESLGPFANCDVIALGSLILSGTETGHIQGLVELLLENGLELTANAA
jgi:hypothetical protein